MLAVSHSFGIIGIDAYPVIIEVDVNKGLPSMTIVGLPDNAVRESRERVRSAIRNSGYHFPTGRITVNLAPADIRKEGPAFDLAIALGILAASEQIPFSSLHRFSSLGELSLNGDIASVTGILSCSLACNPHQFQGLIVPFGNADEAVLAEHIPVYPFKTLAETALFLSEPLTPPHNKKHQDINTQQETTAHDIFDVKGQNHAKRGLEIAAAGGHNILLIGPPGSGKSMLAKRFPGILPPLSLPESIEVTRIHSALPLKNRPHTLIQERPFRAPHHTASYIAMVGGGSDPRPGEVTLAHHGALFLDELPEFSRTTLEALRQPMEDGGITIARSARVTHFPAKFTLLAAMNPCPCGHLMNSRKTCRCASNDITRYMNRISGPLIDRIDLHIEVPSLSARELGNSPNGEKSAIIRTRTAAARHLQNERFSKSTTFANAHMTPKEIQKFCPLNNTCRDMLTQAVDTLGFSARAHDKILKVARTVSDLAGNEDIKAEHLAEAIGYRVLDRLGRY